MPAEIAVHERGISLPCHPYERSRSTTGERSLEYSGVRAGTEAAEESRSAVRRAEGSHRPSPPASTQTEVRSGAVLPGCHCPEHQTIGTVPEHINRAGDGHSLADPNTAKRSVGQLLASPRPTTFSTPTSFIVHYFGGQAAMGCWSTYWRRVGPNWGSIYNRPSPY